MSKKKTLNTSLSQFMMDPSSAFVESGKTKKKTPVQEEEPVKKGSEEPEPKEKHIDNDVTVMTDTSTHSHSYVTLPKEKIAPAQFADESLDTEPMPKPTESSQPVQPSPLDFPILIQPTIRKTAPEKARFQLVINKDVMDRVRAKAQAQGVSVNKVMNDLLAYWVSVQR